MDQAIKQNSAAHEDSDPDFIDVRQRMQEMSVEELCQTAEEFFARLVSWDYLLAKPFAALGEAPELLVCFAQLIQGLRLLPDMKVLDFGAGSGWTSRFLTQLGAEVIALDVSASALRIGRELYARQPVAGAQPSPRFLHFDGRQIELPDESVDRICCLDAFHHVPNPAEVLQEMGRVLKRGGIVGFSEPGPNHSRTPQSQYEMRTNRLIENDILVREIHEQALRAGFSDIRLAVFNHTPLLLSLDEFDDYLSGGAANLRYAEETRAYMQQRRLFFLLKGASEMPSDSRQREGLLAELAVNLQTPRVSAGAPFNISVTVKNIGAAVWLPTTARVGGVHLGAHLFDSAHRLLDLDYFFHALTLGMERRVEPGEIVNFQAQVPAPPPGQYILEFDLVSGLVCWFEHNGSKTVRVRVEVC